MHTFDRRDFLRGASAGASLASPFAALLDKALAIAPATRTGTLHDVEHIVIHAQENRSFDHYFGMLNGVRGLGDPRPLRLPGGKSVWAQPSAQHADGHVLPYHGDSALTRAFTVDGAEQAHRENIHILNHGRFDRWGRTQQLHHRMLHYTAADLPFYYALADAFTVCDAYHCSTLTQTYPNRLHLFTGCNGGGTVGGDPEMTNYGEDETPSADMAQDQPLRPDAYRWTTYAERLQAAGVSWKVYQEYDNFGDNLLSVFPAFRPAPRDGPLYARGRSWVSEHAASPDRERSDGQQLVAAFARDVANGQLPQVSWIVTAADLSEHPKAEPAKGEHITAQLIAALVANPQTFAKTVFLVIYDEAGGFFDHMPPPVPPIGAYQGYSGVSTRGEAKRYPADDALAPGAHPIGLGIRTPALVVSPWSRGGQVCSQLFDHTSVLRFIEARFGVAEPNISPWRRAVCGDLTSAFDFAAPRAAPQHLPSTADFAARVARSAAGSALAIPAQQQTATQMAGQRGHRPLPYALQITPAVRGQHFALTMANRGRVGAALTVHDNTDRLAPFHYTLDAGQSYTSTDWHQLGAMPGYDFTLRGPNGLWCRFAGGFAGALEAVAQPAPAEGALAVVLTNHGTAPARCVLAMAAPYRGGNPAERHVLVAPGGRQRMVLPLAASDMWHDITITSPDEPGFLRRYAGKVETGRTTRTDPGIGAMVFEG